MAGKTIKAEVKYPQSWISWVSAATGSLNALGVECDTVDVAGYSGYAFHMCANSQMCVSGPTILDWDMLPYGARFLGRATMVMYSMECHTSELTNERTQEYSARVFEKVKAEIDSGRPCVVWGLNVPEFGIVYGYDGDSYLSKTCFSLVGREEKPVPFDKLQAPGGPYMVAFPARTHLKREFGDYFAVRRALEMYNQLPMFCTARHGRAAYGAWKDYLMQGTADAWGNSYNAACYAEGRQLASEFFKRMSQRNDYGSQINESVAFAGDHMAKVAQHLKAVSTDFPFPGDKEHIADKDRVNRAVENLAKAEQLEALVMEKLREALAVWQPSEETKAD